MKKIIFVLALLMFSVGANATNSGAGNVTTTTFSDGGNLFFATSAAPINPAGCASTSYVIAGSNAQFRNYYAMLLTSAAGGSDVVVRVDPNSCLTLGSTNYPRVVLVQLRTS